MATITLTALNPSSGRIELAIGNIPSSTKHLRILQVDNNTSAMKKLTVPLPLATDGSVLSSGTYVVEGLTNGNKCDFLITAYGASFNKLSESAVLQDVSAAARPDKPSIDGLVNNDEGAYDIVVNCGSDTGSRILRVIVNLYNKTDDVLRSVGIDVAAGVLTASNRIARLNLTLAGNGLMFDKEYILTATTLNAIGDSDLSEGMLLEVKNLPDFSPSVVLTNVNNVLSAGWSNGDDANNFVGLEYRIVYSLHWLNSLAVSQSFDFHTQTVDADPTAAYTTVNGEQVARPSGAPKYTGSNVHTKSFTPAEIAQIVQSQGIQSIRELSVKCRVISKVGVLESVAKQSNSISFLNVSALVASSISEKISVSSSASRSPSANISLSASMTQADQALLGAISAVSAEAGAARWFNKVVFVGKYNQTSALNIPVVTDMLLELPLTLLSQNTSAALNGSVFASSDSLALSYYLQNAAGDKSAIYALPSQSPRMPSLASNIAAPVCKNGQAYYEFELSKGNASSVYAVINFKVVGQAPITAFNSATLTPQAVPGRPGFVSVSSSFSNSSGAAIPEGSNTELKLALYDLFSVAANPSVDPQFYASTAPVAVVYNNQNNTSLLVQGPTGIVTMVADETLDPQGAHSYALYAGFNRDTFARSQGSNADLVPAQSGLGSEVQMDIDSVKTVKFSLKPSSATYQRYFQAAKLGDLPSDFRVTINGCTSVQAPVQAALENVKNLSGFTGSLADYAWVKCIGAYSAGTVTFNTTGTRSVNGVAYSSDGVLTTQIVDAASIGNIETTKNAVAIQVIFNGASSADLLITSVVEFDPMNTIANIPTQRVTLTPYNAASASNVMSPNGYYLHRFEKPSSAFLIAMATIGAGSSLVCRVVTAVNVAAGHSSVPNIPALPVPTPTPTV
jgi:hypothetical protein